MMNEYLKDFIGQSASKNILDDCKKYILENKVKALGFNPRPNSFSLVHTENGLDNGILDIGASVPDDLVTDNLGKTLAQMHRSPSTTAQQVITLNDITNTPFTFKPYWFADVNAGNTDWAGMLVQLAGGVNCGIQIGSGVTLATRQDFNIETPFVNGGLEDNRFGIQVPVYDNTNFRCNFANSIIATGAGTINETVMLNNYMKDLPRSVKTLCMARDNISPAVSFIAAQSIFVDYVFQF